ncbi:MAG: DUF262 domain-containing protein [Lachnospiraceae bacterium]|nr:DUF262 domain-containing protein [Lachnospiraceae bacterium]
MQSLKKLIEYFNNSGMRVIIPMLQRNYKWEAGNYEQRQKRNTAYNLAYELYSEAKDAILNPEKAKDHIMGIVTVYIDEQKKEIQLLDGQQRLITLSLMMKVLSELNGQTLKDNWFELFFERDDKDNPCRHNYLYNKDANPNVEGVDCIRMRKNLKATVSAL